MENKPEEKKGLAAAFGETQKEIKEPELKQHNGHAYLETCQCAQCSKKTKKIKRIEDYKNEVISQFVYSLDEQDKLIVQISAEAKNKISANIKTIKENYGNSNVPESLNKLINDLIIKNFK